MIRKRKNFFSYKQRLTLAGHQGYPFNFAKTVSPGIYSFADISSLSHSHKKKKK